MSDSKYCSYCGAPLPEGSAYCSRCGRPVAAGGAAYTTGQTMPPRRHGEKDEKNEKDEKQEKGEKDEKGGKDNWITSLFGGLVLIWLGIVFAIAVSQPSVGWNNWWNYFLAGLGIILVLEGILLGARRGSFAPFYWLIVGGVIVALIGIGPLFWTYAIWPYIVIILGVFVILVAIFGRRRTPRP